MGPIPVGVNVGGPVAAVELVLDGRPVAVLSAPRWQADVELGAQIVPHELVARALSGDRTELARARQWLNLPRPPAEVEILLEHGGGGAAATNVATAARLSWESVTGEEPRTVRASFNRRPLAVSADRVAVLPPYDPEQAQLLTVELEFANEVRARKDVVLGGSTGEQAGSELTAIPIRARSGGKAPAAAADVRGLLRIGERPLTVAALEDGDGILVVVRDVQAARGLGRWHFGLGDFRTDLGLDSQTAIRLIWPRPAAYRGARMPADLFPTSHEFHLGDGGLRWVLTRVVNPKPEPRTPRFADAVAVAGLHACGTFRRRAVLLVLDPEAEDSSQHSPEVVRRFLASLRVPLYVWSLGPRRGEAAGDRVWTEAVDVSSESALRDSFQKIKAELDGQRIVWVEGKILPQEVVLAPGPASASFELVR